MQDSARSLARYGRHGDNNLVHVSDKELRGIETLTGKKFTRNPHTGLPEAFSFGQVLGIAAPIIAGIGGTMLGGPAGGAAAAGLTSAAVGKMQGKSNEQALTQGLISGITSYAGGQIMAGVPEAAATSELASRGAAQEAALQASGTTALPANLSPSAPGYTGAESAGAASAYQAATGPANPSGIADAGLKIGNNLSNIVSNPEAVTAKIGENIQAKPFSALMAASGTYAQAMDALSQRPYIPGETPYDPNKYPPKYPENPRTWNPPPSSYVPGTSPEWRYFAKGGIASLANEDRGMTSNIMNEAKAAVLGEHPRPSDALNRFRETFGDDALAVLRDRLTGGRVRGAGGGMDDLVPGTIEGRQKVRLADGEFVVPADVVSGLGDGSTDQGVRRLHEMMDKVRKTRTGKEAQPKAIGGRISV